MKKKPGKQSVVSIEEIRKNRFHAIEKSLDKKFGKSKETKLGWTNQLFDYGKRYLK